MKTIGNYEIRYDDEETLQYEVVKTISGNLLGTFPSEPEAVAYARGAIPWGDPARNSVYFPESASTSSAWIKSSSSAGWVQKPSLSKIRSMPQFCDKTSALIERNC